MPGQECSDCHPCGDDIDAGYDSEGDGEAEYYEEFTPSGIFSSFHIPINDPGTPNNGPDEFVEEKYHTKNHHHKHRDWDTDNRKYENECRYRHEDEKGDSCK